MILLLLAITAASGSSLAPRHSLQTPTSLDSDSQSARQRLRRDHRPQPLRLRGGGRQRSKVLAQEVAAGLPPLANSQERWSLGNSSIKLVPGWNGDVADLVIGSAIGFSGGWLLGCWGGYIAQTLMSSTVAFPAFLCSHIAFTAAVGVVAMRADLVTINFKTIALRFGGFLGRIAPLRNTFDLDGDGKLSWRDLEVLFNQVLGRRVGQAVSKALKSRMDQDGDGKFTHRDVSYFLAGNKHASLGIELGLLLGFGVAWPAVGHAIYGIVSRTAMSLPPLLRPSWLLKPLGRILA